MIVTVTAPKMVTKNGNLISTTENLLSSTICPRFAISVKHETKKNLYLSLGNIQAIYQNLIGWQRQI